LLLQSRSFQNGKIFDFSRFLSLFMMRVVTLNGGQGAESGRRLNTRKRDHADRKGTTA
jgi:hypothetical protein